MFPLFVSWYVSVNCILRRDRNLFGIRSDKKISTILYAQRKTSYTRLLEIIF